MSTVGGGVNIVTNGLVLYLDASNTKSYISGSTIWNDVSRSGNNGTLTNGPTFNSANGGSIVFDGVDDYVNQTTYNTNEIIPATSNNFSIDIWFRMTSNPTDTGFLVPGLFGVGGGSTNTFQYISFGPLPSRVLKLRWFDGTQNGKTSNTILNLNQWYNITCSVSSGVILFYINSVVESSYTGNNLTNRTNVTVPPLYQLGDSYYGKFTGNISNVKIYNRALSASEVLQNYNATKSRFGL
jgi:hypothetical protein